MITLNPMEDGITHCNIYTRGATQLGKDLSNLSSFGIKHPKYGNFESLEAFWYWLSTGKEHDELRNLTGSRAKFEGKKLPRRQFPDFQQEFKEGMVLRLEQHPSLLEELKKSTLPFSHYYWFGSDPSNAKVIDVTERHQWQLDVYESYRKRQTTSSEKQQVTVRGTFKHPVARVSEFLLASGYVIIEKSITGKEPVVLGSLTDDETRSILESLDITVIPEESLNICVYEESPSASE